MAIIEITHLDVWMMMHINCKNDKFYEKLHYLLTPDLIDIFLQGNLFDEEGNFKRDRRLMYYIVGAFKSTYDEEFINNRMIEEIAKMKPNESIPNYMKDIDRLKQISKYKKFEFEY
jgi:hypothetical protein